MSNKNKKLKTESDHSILENENNQSMSQQQIQHTFFPRSMFDYDVWNRPLTAGAGPLTTLDLFDPFDTLDNSLVRNLIWIDQPDFLHQVLAPVVPKVPHKYRITVDCQGYQPASIKTELNEDKSKLIVSAREGDSKPEEADGDYSVKEFKRSYNLPDNVESDKMASFVTRDGKLVVEFPIKEEEKPHPSETGLLPVVSDAGDGIKKITVRFTLPNSVDPSEVKVTCKDRDLIVQAEHKSDKADEVSQFYFYRRSTLPENADIDALKCVLENNNMLAIEVPINESLKPNNKTIPVENRASQQISIQNASSNGH